MWNWGFLCPTVFMTSKRIWWHYGAAGYRLGKYILQTRGASEIYACRSMGILKSEEAKIQVIYLKLELQHKMRSQAVLHSTANYFHGPNMHLKLRIKIYGEHIISVATRLPASNLSVYGDTASRHAAASRWLSLMQINQSPAEARSVVSEEELTVNCNG